MRFLESKKPKKIFVVVSSDVEVRRETLAKLAVAKGFAAILSDARKIISSDLGQRDLVNDYFVLCDTYNFRGAVHTNQRLYELAALGLFVAVGVKSLPREYEMICEPFYPDDYR